MNRTTGAEATALSMAVRTSDDSRRVCNNDFEMRGSTVEEVADGCSAESAPRNACNHVSCRATSSWIQSLVRGLLNFGIAS